MSQQLVRQNTGLGFVGVPLGLASWLLKGGFFIAAMGGAYLLLRKAILFIKKGQLLKDVGTNSLDGVAISYASRFYAAFFQGNTEWWNDVFGDGTDEDAIMKLAQEMSQTRVPFALVANKYQTLHDRDLLGDLTRELSSDDVQRFNSILTTGLGNVLEMPRLIEHDLVTNQLTVAYAADLTPLQQVPPNVWLGGHTETVITPGLGTFHGFSYQDQTRFVPATAVRFQSARA